MFRLNSSLTAKSVAHVWIGLVTLIGPVPVLAQSHQTMLASGKIGVCPCENGSLHCTCGKWVIMWRAPHHGNYWMWTSVSGDSQSEVKAKAEKKIESEEWVCNTLFRNHYNTMSFDDDPNGRAYWTDHTQPLCSGCLQDSSDLLQDRKVDEALEYLPNAISKLQATEGKFKRVLDYWDRLKKVHAGDPAWAQYNLKVNSALKDYAEVLKKALEDYDRFKKGLIASTDSNLRELDGLIRDFGVAQGKLETATGALKTAIGSGFVPPYEQFKPLESVKSLEPVMIAKPGDPVTATITVDDTAAPGTALVAIERTSKWFLLDAAKQAVRELYITLTDSEASPDSLAGFQYRYSRANFDALIRNMSPEQRYYTGCYFINFVDNADTYDLGIKFGKYHNGPKTPAEDQVVRARATELQRAYLDSVPNRTPSTPSQPEVREDNGLLIKQVAELHSETLTSFSKESVVSDLSKAPVPIQKQYVRYMNALERKDFAALSKVLSPNFTFRSQKGEVLSADKWKESQKARMKTKGLRVHSNILSSEDNGDNKIITRSEIVASNGTLTSQTVKDTLVNQKGLWLLKSTMVLVEKTPIKSTIVGKEAPAGNNVADLLALIPEFIQQSQEAAEKVADAKGKARILTGIAWAQMQGGDVVGAKQTFSNAKQVVEGITDTSAKESQLVLLAQYQADSGDVTGAKQTAEGVGSSSGRFVAFLRIAEAQAKSGDVAGAKQTAEGLTSDYAKATTLSSIAEAQAKSGDVAGAKQTFNDAKQMAEGITNNTSKHSSLNRIAEAQAKSGDVTGAKQTAEGITSAYVKARVLSSIAEAQAHAGDVAGAKQTFNDAKQMAEGITDTADKSRTLIFIIEAQAKSRDVAGAKQTADSIANVYFKVVALSSIAEAQAKSGDVAGAKQTLNNAKQAAEEITDAYDKGIFLEETAIEIGNIVGKK